MTTLLDVFRFMERIIALILLVILSPFLLIVYLLVKLSSKGPFIFKQKRAGKDFKVFTMYKVRTMVDGANQLKDKIKDLNEADGPVFKIKNDPRFTLLGKFLSRIGIDEILQLVNIIKGEMSFVGPRPLPIDEAKKVPEKYRERFSIKPGITSLWVIKGAHSLSFAEWMELDQQYVKKKNFLLDSYIIIATILLIIRWTIKELIVSMKKSSSLFSL